jgi:hypothetical protein
MVFRNGSTSGPDRLKRLWIAMAKDVMPHYFQGPQRADGESIDRFVRSLRIQNCTKSVLSKSNPVNRLHCVKSVSADVSVSAWHRVEGVYR